jgi:hypothetical protein
MPARRFDFLDWKKESPLDGIAAIQEATFIVGGDKPGGISAAVSTPSHSSACNHPRPAISPGRR